MLVWLPIGEVHQDVSCLLQNVSIERFCIARDLNKIEIVGLSRDLQQSTDEVDSRNSFMIRNLLRIVD